MDVSRVEGLLAYLNRGLIEREDTVAIVLLAVLSGQSAFLYGPPGTAKSLIASRIASVFEDSQYFEYLMQRFSTPEEIFGPVSISELRNDRYVRNTEGFLPEANLAFLDEIWKSSPAILNALLTILNERKFRNGNRTEEVPLRAIIAASNEFPAEGSGLEALYDRFIVRRKVAPIRTKRGFDRLMNPKQDKVIAPIKITRYEWDALIRDSEGIPISKEALSTMDDIRKGINKINKEHDDSNIYVSDRRWANAAKIMRTSALICGKDSVMPEDCLLLKDILWSSDEDSTPINVLVTDSIKANLSPEITKLHELDSLITSLEADIRLFSETSFKDCSFLGKQVFTKGVATNRILSLELGGNNVEVPEWAVKSGGTYSVSVPNNGYYGNRQVMINFQVCDNDAIEFTAEGKRYVLMKRKDPIMERKRIRNELLTRLGDISTMINGITTNRKSDRSYVDSPFLSDSDNKMVRSLLNGDSDMSESYRYRLSAARGLLNDRF